MPRSSVETGDGLTLLCVRAPDAHANLKAAQKLLDRRWGTLRIFLLPEMMHAKAVLAHDGTENGLVSLLGSANLVRGSLNLPVWCELLPYDELSTLVQDQPFCESLKEAMDQWYEIATPVPSTAQLLQDSDWYSELSAWLDELWQ